MRRILYIICALIEALNSFSQQSDGYGVNLPKYYKRKINYGFTIAGNNCDFRLNPKPNSVFPDTVIGESRYKVKTVYSIPLKGFAIGMVSDVRINEYVRLRFTPNISFASRKIQYSLATADRDSFKVFEKSVESVFLIFPLET